MFLHAPELQWESRLNEYIETTRSKLIPLGASGDIVCVGKCPEIVMVFLEVSQELEP